MNAAFSLINLRMLWTQSATVATMPPFRLLCQVASSGGVMLVKLATVPWICVKNLSKSSRVKFVSSSLKSKVSVLRS
ncbi:hypothetical protein [Nostoc sp.]|uniref:hypothetical protein n=1 Tax=Nostoc sp. TaxID=1180 RepID=UPI002FFC0454